LGKKGQKGVVFSRAVSRWKSKRRKDRFHVIKELNEYKNKFRIFDAKTSQPMGPTKF